MVGRELRQARRAFAADRLCVFAAELRRCLVRRHVHRDGGRQRGARRRSGDPVEGQGDRGRAGRGRADADRHRRPVVGVRGAVAQLQPHRHRQPRQGRSRRTPARHHQLEPAGLRVLPDRGGAVHRRQGQPDAPQQRDHARGRRLRRHEVGHPRAAARRRLHQQLGRRTRRDHCGAVEHEPGRRRCAPPV